MLNNIIKKEKIITAFPIHTEPTIAQIKPPIKQERTKLWELDHNYHCTIIGTCLTMSEVKKLLRSFHIDITHVSSYEIHTAIVTLISSNDFPSKKTQSYLDKKFKVALQKTKKMQTDALKDEWKRVINNGELIATFWAVMSHPLSSEVMKKKFYGDIHMLSHMSGASNRADLKRLTALENEKKEFNTETQLQLIKYQKLQIENNHLQVKKQLQIEKTNDLINRVDALTNANEQLMVLNNVTQCRELTSRLEKLNKVVTKISNQNSIDKKALSAYKNEVEHLQYLLCKNQEKNECLFNKQGLCGQCILYVGGKSNLIPHYRDMIEAKSGDFIHHDGGLEKNTQDLSDSLTRADWVVFPSDCISHDAYWKIKTACKKQQKPYEYLKSPGLHSLSNVLDKIMKNNKAGFLN